MSDRPGVSVPCGELAARPKGVPMEPVEWHERDLSGLVVCEAKAGHYSLLVVCGRHVDIGIKHAGGCVASAYLQTTDLDTGKRVAETMLEILLKQEKP